MKRIKRTNGSAFFQGKTVLLQPGDEETSKDLSQKSICIYSNISVEDLQQGFLKVDPDEGNTSDPKKSRGTINVINEKVAVVLDQLQLSSIKAVYIITAIAQSLGHDLNYLVVNRTYMQNCREQLSEIKVKNI